MALLLVSFIAGVLTVLAPCILPLLPVVLGTSALSTPTGRTRSTPYVVVGSLIASVIIFTYLLKASTALIMVPPAFWTYLSGGILTILGLVLLFPQLWERLPGVGSLAARSNKLVGTGYQKQNFWGNVIIGASLGPVFSSCSPTYFVILASVLPASFALGSLYLLAYSLGLGLVLLLIGKLGQRFAAKLARLADPKSYFKRAIGLLFVLLGVAIILGYEKKLEISILDSGYFDVTKLEQKLLKLVNTSGESSSAESNRGEPYREIVSPAGFVNTPGITLAELVGKKVILVDFMTYSCINCQRTFPYLVDWYQKYRDEGLEIVGIHTPEFAFEKDRENVAQAMREFGITYPVVLDNDYATWRAYGNQFWPRKYLIDIHGNIVYDHIGEGAYRQTEEKIRELLIERAEVLGEAPGPNTAAPLGAAEPGYVQTIRISPEIYFGSSRHNPNSGLELQGGWEITPEYAEGGVGNRIIFPFRARQVFMVASGPATIAVRVDGELVNTLLIDKEKLYNLVENEQTNNHLLEIEVKAGKLRAYTFTFG